jgi:hypothetical protein
MAIITTGTTTIIAPHSNDSHDDELTTAFKLERGFYYYF